MPDGPLNPWGEQKKPYKAPDGYYACGAMVRREPNQGMADDSAMNGLELIFCQLGNWDRQSSARFDGAWGNWGSVKMCPRGYFVTAAKGQF